MFLCVWLSVFLFVKSESVHMSELSVCLQASGRLGEPMVSGVVKFHRQTFLNIKTAGD